MVLRTKNHGMKLIAVPSKRIGIPSTIMIQAGGAAYVGRQYLRKCGSASSSASYDDDSGPTHTPRDNLVPGAITLLTPTEHLSPSWIGSNTK